MESEVKIRWMEKNDLRDVARIQGEGNPEIALKFVKSLVRKKSSICSVAEIAGKIVGFLCYETSGVSKIKISCLVVDKSLRRQKIGSKMIQTIISKLNEKRSKIEAIVSEYNLTAQLFLKNENFKVVKILNNESGTSDYKFVYNIKEISV